MAELTSTQKRILEKAKEHFLREGFKSASLRQIVKEAGFTQGAFYGYYKTKEELFCALTDETAEGIKKILLRISEEMDALPEETRMLKMSECYMKALPELVDFLYDHHDELTLLMTRSEGTRYENFLGGLQNLSQTNTTRRIHASPVQLPMQPMALKAVMDTYYSAVFAVLLANLSKEDTYYALMDIQRFYQNGFLSLIKTGEEQ